MGRLIQQSVIRSLRAERKRLRERIQELEGHIVTLQAQLEATDGVEIPDPEAEGEEATPEADTDAGDI